MVTFTCSMFYLNNTLMYEMERGNVSSRIAFRFLFCHNIDNLFSSSFIHMIYKNMRSLRTFAVDSGLTMIWVDMLHHTILSQLNQQFRGNEGIVRSNFLQLRSHVVPLYFSMTIDMLHWFHYPPYGALSLFLLIQLFCLGQSALWPGGSLIILRTYLTCFKMENRFCHITSEQA